MKRASSNRLPEFPAIAPYLHGQHAVARHGFRKYGAIAGGSRTAARHAAGGICWLTAGRGAPPPWLAKGASGRGARRFAAAGNSRATEANLYSALGGMVAWAAACANGGELRRPCAVAGALFSPGGRSLGLDGFSCRENQLVAPVVLVCAERVVPPAPRRIVLRLR